MKRWEIDEARAEEKLKKLRDRIRGNFPDERAPLTWRKVSGNRIESGDGRFAIEAHGTGEKRRYDAILRPNHIIGPRLHSAERAKEICCNHASPLPLEAPKEKENA